MVESYREIDGRIYIQTKGVLSEAVVGVNKSHYFLSKKAFVRQTRQPFVPVYFSVPYDDFKKRSEFVHDLLRENKLGRTVFFESPELKHGFCMVRSVEYAKSKLQIPAHCIKPISATNYKKMIHVRKKSKHWTFILEGRGVARMTFATPVNARFVAKAKNVASKTLCFCSSMADFRGRPRKSRFYRVRSGRMPVIKHDEVDKILCCKYLDRLKVKRDRSFGVFVCHEPVTSSALKCEAGMSFLELQPSTRLEYERLTAAHPEMQPFKCATHGVGGVRKALGTLFSFDNMPAVVILNFMTAASVKAFSGYLCNPLDLKSAAATALYSGIVKFTKKMCIDDLPGSPTVWYHVGIKYSRILTHLFKTKSHELEELIDGIEKEIGVIAEDEAAETKKRRLDSLQTHLTNLRAVYLNFTHRTAASAAPTRNPLSNVTGKYLYWQNKAMNVWQVLDRLRKDEWLGIVSYKKAGIVVKTATRRRPQEIPFMTPLTCYMYRKIERHEDKSEEYYSFGDMNAPNKVVSSHTRCWFR